MYVNGQLHAPAALPLGDRSDKWTALAQRDGCMFCDTTHNSILLQALAV
jgi:hypothetical protein